jgi:hypothetical protein
MSLYLMGQHPIPPSPKGGLGAFTFWGLKKNAVVLRGARHAVFEYVLRKGKFKFQKKTTFNIWKNLNYDI